MSNLSLLAFYHLLKKTQDCTYKLIVIVDWLSHLASHATHEVSAGKDHCLISSQATRQQGLITWLRNRPATEMRWLTIIS